MNFILIMILGSLLVGCAMILVESNVPELILDWFRVPVQPDTTGVVFSPEDHPEMYDDIYERESQIFPIEY